MDKFLKTGTDEGKTNIAMQALFKLKLSKADGLDAMIEEFRQLANEAKMYAGGEHDKLLVNIMIHMITEAKMFTTTTQSFRQLKADEQTLERLITMLREYQSSLHLSFSGYLKPNPCL